MRKVFIGDFLHRIRRPINLVPDKKYRLVTIKLKHKGVVLREKKLASNIKSKMYEVKEGDFILSGIDARNGAFGIVPKELDCAIVTNDFWYFDIDKSIVNKDFFLELTSTHWFDEICRKGSDGTTQRIRLQKNKFFNQEIYLPPLEDQNLFISNFKQNKNNNNALKAELVHQQVLLKKLRQQILQEAIEGKLTADWRRQNPDIEPASELLKRIKAEKEQLIKEKKIKNQKSLPPISEEEKPFDLPKGWAWCRLGEICDYITKGTTPPSSELLSKGDVPYLKVYNIVDQEIAFEYKAQFVRRGIHEKLLKRSKVFPHDVLMNIVGPPLGKVALVPSDYAEWNINQAIAIFRPIIPENSLFIYYFLREGAPIRAVELKGVVGQDNISLTQSRELIMALPPLQEQKTMVGKVKKLLALCDQLETQITQNQTHAEQLMQAVLKEAFTQGNAQPERVKVNA